MFAQRDTIILEAAAFNAPYVQHLCLIVCNALLSQLVLSACQAGPRLHNVLNVLLVTLVEAAKIVMLATI